MWTCPACKHKFYNKNQPHSCGSYGIDDFLKGKSRIAIELLDFFLDEYKKIGDFDLHPVKTRMALVSSMRFCSINKIGTDYVNIHFILTDHYPDNSCFYKVENLAGRFFVCHFKLLRQSDINPEVRKFMKLAYEVGKRRHIRTSS